jgi:antitoxin HicB
MTRTRFTYPVTLDAEADGAFSVSFGDLPEALTHGRDRAEALAQAADALLGTVATRMTLREDIPRPSRLKRGQVLVPLPTLAAAKVALYQIMRGDGVSMAELARRVGCDFRQVSRLLDINHGSRLDQLDAAFAALGKRLVVEVRDAA